MISSKCITIKKIEVEKEERGCVEIIRANNCFNKTNKDFDWIINKSHVKNNCFKSRDRQ